MGRSRGHGSWGTHGATAHGARLIADCGSTRSTGSTNQRRATRLCRAVTPLQAGGGRVALSTWKRETRQGRKAATVAPKRVAGPLPFCAPTLAVCAQALARARVPARIALARQSRFSYAMGYRGSAHRPEEANAAPQRLACCCPWRFTLGAGGRVDMSPGPRAMRERARGVAQGDESPEAPCAIVRCPCQDKPLERGQSDGQCDPKRDRPIGGTRARGGWVRRFRAGKLPSEWPRTSS